MNHTDGLRRQPNKMEVYTSGHSGIHRERPREIDVRAKLHVGRT